MLVASALSAGLVTGCGSGASPTAPSTPGGRPAPPTFAKTIDLRPVSGSVRIKLPGTNAFAALTGPRLVPVGTIIDVSGGVVHLIAAYPTAGQSAAGDFRDGVFEVLQDPAGRGLTDLRVQDTLSERSACRAGKGARRQLTARQLGLILGDARGRFRTEGEFSAATVRGTAWGVRNRCDGTLTIVRRGVMLVTDFRLHRSIILHAGQTYLAKAP